MNMVIDSSAIIASVMRDPERGALAEAASGHVLIAPDYVRWEICHVFSVMIRQKGIDAEEARSGMEILGQHPAALRGRGTWPRSFRSRLD